jgi:hypothetical protein
MNRFIKRRINIVLDNSEDNIRDISMTTAQGKYRIRELNHYNIFEHISAFTGTSNVFEVKNIYHYQRFKI